MQPLTDSPRREPRARWPIAGSVLIHLLVLYAIATQEIVPALDERRKPVTVRLAAPPSERAAAETPASPGEPATARPDEPAEPPAPRSVDPAAPSVDAATASTTDPAPSGTAGGEASDEPTDSADATSLGAQPSAAERRLPAIIGETQRALDAAEADIEREGAYVRFSFEDILRATPRETFERRKTAFDSPAFGRAGMRDRNPLGQVTVWISDECMVTYGNGNLFLYPAGEEIANVGTINCFGTKPRDDIFEDVKPAYLIARPPGAQLPID